MQLSGTLFNFTYLADSKYNKSKRGKSEIDLKRFLKFIILMLLILTINSSYLWEYTLKIANNILTFVKAYSKFMPNDEIRWLTRALFGSQTRYCVIPWSLMFQQRPYPRGNFTISKDNICTDNRAKKKRLNQSLLHAD